MKKTNRKRLTLDRDIVKTLVELSSGDLPHIRGGVLQPGPIHPRSTGGSTNPGTVVDDMC
jgi:hypothetical protein